MNRSKNNHFTELLNELIAETLDPAFLKLESRSDKDLENLLEKSLSNARNGIEGSRELMAQVDRELKQTELLQAEIYRRTTRIK